MKALRVTVSPGALVRFLYADSLCGLLNIGEATIKRGSHVEPTALNLWVADMSPSGGPKIGPFRLREDALDAEATWLLENDFGEAKT